MLAVAAVVLVLTLSGNDAEKVAADFGDLMEQYEQDPAAVPVQEFQPILCESFYTFLETQEESATPGWGEGTEGLTVNLNRVETDGDQGRAYYDMASPGEDSQLIWFALTKENDDWKVCEAN